MSSLQVAILVLGCLLSATIVGMVLRRSLPEHHMSMDSKDVIRLATAVVGTLSALALGLLISSAKTTYDDADNELRSTAARLVLLDRLMAHYGEETQEARRLLKDLIETRLARSGNIENDIDSETERKPADFQYIETMQDMIRHLTPQTDPQRMIQTRALEVSGVIAEDHWLTVETAHEGLPLAFLIILTLWLTLLFATFGLQAPVNATVIIILAVCALSAASAIFLISEMANPYRGLVHISDEPIRLAAARLGKP